MNAKFSKRILSYLIDLIILVALIGILMTILNYNNNTNLINIEKEIETINNNYIEGGITFSEYYNQYGELSYMIDKEEIPLNIINSIFIIILYILVPFLLKGATIGMRLMNIKIVNNNDTAVSINALALRCLLINFLGYLLITLGSIFILPSFSYFILSFILTILEFLLVIISGFMVLYKRDKRGIHDIISKTKVVNI